MPQHSYTIRSIAMAFVTLAWLSWSSPAIGTEPETSGGGTVTRVLIVGDSWAELMWQGTTMRTVFANNGRSDILEDGDTTTISGSTAAEWTSTERLQLITDALAAQPSIDVMQLSLGGNDFLAGQSGGGWHTGMTAQEFTDLLNRVLTDITTVVSHAQTQRPGLEVVLSHYDYGNFEDSAVPTCPGTLADLGSPTPQMLNDALTDFQDAVDAYANATPSVTSVRHLGLMQFFFGFPNDGIDPGDLIPPGDLSRPSPIAAMFLGIDCFHLGSVGYGHLGNNLWDHFYDSHFNGTIFRDGFESGDTSAWAP